MDVILQNIGKRYANKEWIFKDLNYHFCSGERIALTGNNGSGKSTLLKTIGGMVLPSKGEIAYKLDENTIAADQLLHHIAFASPYLELIEDFTLLEMVTFHFKFKKSRNQLSSEDLIQKMYLEGNENKHIKNFSSGMKQRLKLGLCFYTEASLILLDEPCSNLDRRGYDWYHEQIENLPKAPLVIIASNQEEEYQFCKEIIRLG
ncbi:ABC transporter ATP-binding protein [Reichenbachiella ulvae]|uniref:ATP-binding cassette domain-containing protein n=1 Tax=Reichenbachiella ulvae TaxID=2980104 RepID=A0ABT3D162_9BACT|nr:ATP-binding cassette domain-containing protein [Reichenbachiella ulvae]MCV9389173.1 ATP-binding cassette domain-containing protein [Reichenbachiella ulvae]